MDYETQLRLQSYLDDELCAREKGDVEALLTRDPEAQALLAELRQTSGALAGFETGMSVPESREFFWSKIEREISRQPATVLEAKPFWMVWRRWLVPAGSFAALALVALVAVLHTDSVIGIRGDGSESAYADPGAFTYRDYAAGTTLVWLSYPAENGLADDDPDAILD